MPSNVFAVYLKTDPIILDSISTDGISKMKKQVCV